MVTTTYVYLEGGGDSKEQHSRCREAFRTMLERSGFQGRMPRLVACGGRRAVYDDFVTRHKSETAPYVAMWIDSEDPMADIEKAWDHLATVETVEAFEKPPGATDDQVLFMSTCMETWIVADRNTLKKHYGKNLRGAALPSLMDLENRLRHDVQDRLERATRNCSNAYTKGKRSFEVFCKLRPDTLKTYLPSFIRILTILERRL